MSYDLEPEKREQPPRRPHPLEAPPPTPLPRTPGEGAPRQVMLRIPVVKPLATQALIAVNVVIYVLAFYVISDAQLNDLYDWGANNRLYVLDLREFHRLFTAMFLHGEIIMHIVFNMYALYVIGQTVERLFGHTRFLLLYFLGGLTGSILSVLLNDNNVWSVGASGAVFAIFGAEMVFLYKHQKLLGKLARLQLRQLLIVAGMNLAMGILSSTSGAAVRIDNWGHVGGFVGGLAIAWIIGPILSPELDLSRPESLNVVDMNPLRRNILPVMIYGAGLVALVLMGASAAQRGAF